MRKTKLAMLQSVVALILCAAMLVGTTFAWFTDEVTSAVNKIQAGTLDVDLVDAAGNSLEGTSLTFMDVTGNTDILWEPGCTFKTQGFRVANRGSLALEYTMYINGLLGDSKLLEVIRFSVQDADGYTVDIDTFEGQHSARASSDVFYLVGHMDENAGNEYMNLTLTCIGITVYATQAMEENDSFGPEYDKDAFFPGLDAPILGSVNITTENDLLTADAYIDVEGAKVTIPAGTRVKPGTTTLKLRVKLMDETTSDVKLSDNQVLQPMDVTVEGVSDDNQVPLTVELYEIAPVGLNMGSIALHHVHKGVTAPMTRVAADAAFTADNQYRYDPATGDLALHMATFSEVAVVADTENAWEGKLDYTWYDASKTALTIANADQLAALGAIVGGMAKDESGNFLITYTDSDGDEHHNDSFSGKTVKLIADINLGDGESKNNPDLIFYPIGYWNSEGTYEKTGTAISSGFYAFQGTFDGNGNTISNFYQNTWEMKGDHDWYDAKLQYFRDGMGLFGRVYKGTVKNLTIKNFSSDGEITTTGCVAAYADGATFENIAIFNCNPRVYNIGNGGIVGCVGWYAKEENLKTTFKNITVDNSNKISALWGSYDVACGGIVGQYYPTSGQTSAGTPKNGGIEFTNCHVSAVMDVYNDVCANYQYYAYRYTGMLIGSVRENETIDGHVYPKMDKITATDCTVHFGDWNDYYYCELVANSLASYTHDHQMSRLEQVASVDVANKTVTDLAGKTMAIPTSGRVNYVVVKAKDANGMWIHGDGHDYAECYHFVNGVQHFHDVADADNPNPTETVNGVAGVLKEDKQLIYREFNNLVTGYGWGVTSRGFTNLDGVTNLDITEGHENSVVKFKGKVTELANNKEYKLGDIFTFVDNNVELVPGALAVSVHNLDENNPVSATIVYDRENWENGTITLTGTGTVKITIQDYYFCTPTTITVNVTERQNAEKFAVVMNNGDFLHRVGNVGTVALGKLFAAKSGASIGTVSVTVEAVNGTAASGTYTSNATWTNGTIQFNGTGVVKVTIKDDDKYCTPTVLYLEVVDAKNVTGAENATANNVVLLNNCEFSSFEVSGGYTLYGNGFTLECKNDSVAIDRTYSFVALENGTLDNVQIIVPNFSHSILYDSNKTENNNPSSTDNNGRTRYNNIRSAVVMKGNSKIANSFVSGGRAAVYCIGGKSVIENSTIKGGAAANIHVESNGDLTLRNITLIQKPIKANVNTTSNTVMGFSVIAVCDANGGCAPITVEGTLRQYAWANKDYSVYVPEKGQSVISEALEQKEYIHSISYDGVEKDSVNLGFVYMPDGLNPVGYNLIDNRADDKSVVPYGKVGLSSDRVWIYTYKNTGGTHTDVKVEPSYSPDKQTPVLPSVNFADINDYRTFDIAYNDGWTATLNADVDHGSFVFAFNELLVQKYGKNLSYTIQDVNGNTVDASTTISLNDSGVYEFTLLVTDDQIYNYKGVKTSETFVSTYKFKIVSTKSSIDPPVLDVTSKGSVLTVGEKGLSTTWNIAIPALEEIKVTYWSGNASVTKTLSELCNLDNLKGQQSTTGENNSTWTYAGSDFTLTITGGTGKSGKYTKPVVVNETLYFVVENDGLCNTSTTNRDITLTYTFTDSNQQSTSAVGVTWSHTYNKNETMYDHSDFMNGTLKTAGSGCFAEGTLITLADGTKKPIEQVTYEDQLLAWDFNTGAYVATVPSLIESHEAGEYRVINLKFADGTVTRVIVDHGFFCVEENNFVFIDEENVDSYVGKNFVKVNGGSYDSVELVGYDVTVETVSYYTIQTAIYNNCIAENMFTLTSPPEMLENDGWFDYFEIGEGMKYDEAKMQADIEKYGLYTYEDFAEYVTYEQFIAFNGPYLKVLVGRGVITFEQIIELIGTYVNN